jgi:uncharacterized protein
MMPRNHERLHIVSRGGAPAGKPAGRGRSRHESRTVSGRWLLSALILTIGGAALCGWFSLCLLFWQGSWQLLYHPTATVTRTPSSVGLQFEPIQFAVTNTGVPRLNGWWIAARPDDPYHRFTVLYLHDQSGNLGDAVDALAQLHAIGVNVLAFDYRGYGQSQFARPSEAHWREDANWALAYMAGTRHVNPGKIVLDGAGLGADLAMEVAASHPELAGVILISPAHAPMNAVFMDPRARLVPAHMLVRDHYDLDAAAEAVRIPVLWFEQESAVRQTGGVTEMEAYEKVKASKMLVWLGPAAQGNQQFGDACSRWLDNLPAH